MCGHVWHILRYIRSWKCRLIIEREGIHRFAMIIWVDGEAPFEGLTTQEVAAAKFLYQGPIYCLLPYSHGNFIVSKEKESEREKATAYCIDSNDNLDACRYQKANHPVSLKERHDWLPPNTTQVLYIRGLDGSITKIPFLSKISHHSIQRVSHTTIRFYLLSHPPTNLSPRTTPNPFTLVSIFPNLSAGGSEKSSFYTHTTSFENLFQQSRNALPIFLEEGSILMFS